MLLRIILTLIFAPLLMINQALASRHPSALANLKSHIKPNRPLFEKNEIPLAPTSWLFRVPQKFSALLDLNSRILDQTGDNMPQSLGELWFKSANELSTEITFPNYPIKSSVSYQLKDSLRRAAILRSNLLPTNSSTIEQTLPPDQESSLVHQLLKSPISIGVIDFGAAKENSNTIFKWDYVDNDSMPFEDAVSANTALLKGGNPGVGTEIIRVIQEAASSLKEQIPLSIYRIFNSTGVGQLSDFIQSINRALENHDRVLVSSLDLDHLCHQFSQSLEPFELLLNDLNANLEKNQAYLVLPTGIADEKNEHSLDESCLGEVKFDFQHRILLIAATENNLLSDSSKFGNRTALIAASGERSISSEKSETLTYSQINWNHPIFAASRTAVALTQRLSTSLTIDAGQPLQLLTPFLLPSSSLEAKISSARILNIGNKTKFR